MVRKFLKPFYGLPWTCDTHKAIFRGGGDKHIFDDQDDIMFWLGFQNLNGEHVFHSALDPQNGRLFEKK